MKSIQCASQSNFPSPAPTKEEKPANFQFNSVRAELSSDYKKRIKMLQSTIKNLNFPDISNTNRKPNKPIMIMERVKFVSNNCENPLKLDIFDKNKSESVFPVISYKKAIHRSLKKLGISPMVNGKLSTSPNKLSGCRYSSDYLVPTRDAYGIRTSLPLGKKEMKERNQELSPRTLGETLNRQSTSVMCSPLSPRLLIQEDDFYYLNICKNSSFTSFFTLLECQFESIQNPFPYCGKIFKTCSNRKQQKKNSSSPIKLKQAFCLDSTLKLDSPSLMQVFELRSLIPSVSRIFFHPRNVRFPKNVLIVNLNGLGFEVTQWSRFWSHVKEMSQLVQLVFVICNDFESFCRTCDEFQVKISGIYLVSDLRGYSKEVAKLQDYSQIYADFFVTDLKSQVLIITNHLLEDCDSIGLDIIHRSGFSPKVWATRVPIASIEYPDPPATFLLASHSVKMHLSSLSNLLFHLYSSLFYKKPDFSELFHSDKFETFFCSFILPLLHLLKYPWKSYPELRNNLVIIFKD